MLTYILGGILTLTGFYILGRAVTELRTGAVHGENWKNRRVALLLYTLPRVILGAVLLTAGLYRLF